MHEVYTGYVVGINELYIVDYDVTQVYFRELSRDDILWYLSKKEYICAAGGYRIQGYGKLLVDRIVGDYFNVVGLPIREFIGSLKKLGIEYIEVL